MAKAEDLFAAALFGLGVGLATTHLGRCALGSDGMEWENESRWPPEMQAAAEEVRKAGVAFLSPQALKRKLQSGRPPVLVDVLPGSSYTNQHLRGAINIPDEQIEQLAPRVLPDKEVEVVVYCASYACPASTHAATTLKRLGYTNVRDYKGGLEAWRAAGLPLEGRVAASKR